MAQHLTCDRCGSTERVIRNWIWKRALVSDTQLDRPVEVAVRITTKTNTDGNPMGDVDLCLPCRRDIVVAAMGQHPDGAVDE